MSYLTHFMNGMLTMGSLKLYELFEGIFTLKLNNAGTVKKSTFYGLYMLDMFHIKLFKVKLFF